MDTHDRLAGVLHVVFGVLGLLGALGIALFLAFFASVAAEASSPNRDLAEFWLFLGRLGWGVAGVFALASLAQAVAGGCWLADRRGARGWLIAFSALMLLAVPIGTVVGGYCLWALMRDSTRDAGLGGAA